MADWFNLRLFAVVGVVGLVLGYFGVHMTYVALHDGTQLEISCADYVAKKPDAKWLRLTGCQYDLDHYAFKLKSDSSSEIGRVYLSLRPVGVTTGPTQILVERRDDDMLRVIEWAERGGGRAPPQPAFSHIQAQLDRPIQGLVKFGIDLERREKNDLDKLDLDLARDFVIVDDGARPHLIVGIILIVVGISLAGVCVFLFVREMRRQQAAPPPRPVLGNRPLVRRPLFGNRPLFRRRRR